MLGFLEVPSSIFRISLSIGPAQEFFVLFLGARSLSASGNRIVKRLGSVALVVDNFIKE
jgi:hypothetical protein